MGRGRLARGVVWAGWLVLTFALVWLVALSRTDPGSTILVSVAIGFGAGAIWCAGRALDSRGRARLAWIGRTLALIGAGVAISFPAVLYQEIVMLVGRNEALTYNIPAALWREFWVMPLTIVPALVALRWTRIGGSLFLLQAAFSILDGVYHFGGVNYFPEARMDIAGYLMAYGPVVLTAVLLLAGSERWSGDEGGALASRVAPTPA